MIGLHRRKYFKIRILFFAFKPYGILYSLHEWNYQLCRKKGTVPGLEHICASAEQLKALMRIVRLSYPGKSNVHEII
jgi:hypothetical protein